MVVMSADHVGGTTGSGHAGGTSGSGIVSSTADGLGMSVVRGMRGVGGVCKLCMSLTWGCVGGEGVSV